MCLLALISLLLLSNSSADASAREWTSADGRTLHAEFAGITGAGGAAQVRLKLASGKVVNYPVAKLSEADRKFVETALPSDPALLAAEIDKLVIAKMKESYYGLKADLKTLQENQHVSATEKAKQRAEIHREMQMCIPNEKTSDSQFMRRIYLDVAGRIPTFDEASQFLESRSPNKRSELIDELLDTQAYSMRMFNYVSDLLRVRDRLILGGGQLNAISYMEWIKESLYDDKPFNLFVKEMLTAEGTVWDNPATGYLVTDSGMRLCNLSNTFTVFLGTEITCAQCHDHPFEDVSQMQFYQLAAFMGEYESRKKVDGNPRAEVERMSAILKAAGKMPEAQRFDNRLNNIVNSQRINVYDTGRQVVALPHDYKYDNGKPNEKVAPNTYFGESVNLEEYDTPRDALASWVTSDDNPRFAINLANRLWKLAFGLGQIEPVDNIPSHLEEQAQNLELLMFLEKMVIDQGYSIKDFLRVIYNTDAYQRKAENLTPTLTQVDNGSYHFPGPILRRMSAEQIWDSLVTLTTAGPDLMVRRGAQEYRQHMRTDLTELTTLDAIEKYRNEFNQIGRTARLQEAPILVSLGEKEGEGAGGMAMMMQGSARVGGQQMVRASELQLPMPPEHFLRVFGQSDKTLIENQSTLGSTPQVMTLLNGSITNQVLTNKDAYLIREIAYGKGRKGDKIDKVFLSVLSRLPHSEEKRLANSGMRARRDREIERTDEQREIAAIGDVIWALVNTREFLFIQ